MAEQDKACAHAGRALLKIGLIAALAIGAITLLSHAMSDQVLDELKHNLSMGTIIALVILINAVSFVCFLVLMAAYRWVRRDFKPEDGLDS